MIICQNDKFVEISNNEQMKKICNYHKLLIKFNEIMNNHFLDKKKKSEEFLNLYYRDKETFIELIDFFDFS